MSKSEVFRVDRGLDELKKTVRAIADRNAYVKAGVLEGSGEAPPGELTNGQLAAIQEFGTATIPARPFVSSSFEANRDKYKGMLAAGLEKVYANELPVSKLLGLLGTAMAADIKKRVTAGANFEPNAPSTIAKKGSARPLVDTGRLVNSVTYQVVGAGEGHGGEE